VVDLKGARVREFLQNLLANDVAKLQTSGKALYSCMLKPEGGCLAASPRAIPALQSDWPSDML